MSVKNAVEAIAQNHSAYESTPIDFTQYKNSLHHQKHEGSLLKVSESVRVSYYYLTKTNWQSK